VQADEHEGDVLITRKNCGSSKEARADAKEGEAPFSRSTGLTEQTSMNLPGGQLTRRLFPSEESIGQDRSKGA